MMLRTVGLGAVLVAGGGLLACQSPNDPDATIDSDDFVEVTVTPDPATAEPSVGRTYRVVRGNNQPDEILPYSWKATFSLRILINSRINDVDNYDAEFPVDITSATVKVQQASGGIVTPPTGGEVEHYEGATNASSNRITGMDSPVTVGFEVWYDLPNEKREALAQVTLTFVDNNSATFTKVVDVRIAP